MLKKLRHIGIMRDDFDRIAKKFEGFGLPCTEVVEAKSSARRSVLRHRRRDAGVYCPYRARQRG